MDEASCGARHLPYVEAALQSVAVIVCFEAGDAQQPQHWPQNCVRGTGVHGVTVRYGCVGSVGAYVVGGKVGHPCVLGRRTSATVEG